MPTGHLVFSQLPNRLPDVCDQALRFGGRPGIVVGRIEKFEWFDSDTVRCRDPDTLPHEGTGKASIRGISKRLLQRRVGQGRRHDLIVVDFLGPDLPPDAVE